MAKNKKATSNPVTSTTWLLLGLFFVVSAFSFKIIHTLNQISEAIPTIQDIR